MWRDSEKDVGSHPAFEDKGNYADPSRIKLLIMLHFLQHDFTLLAVYTATVFRKPSLWFVAQYILCEALSKLTPFWESNYFSLLFV